MSPEDELDFQWVVGRIRFLNDLLPPSPKASRVLPPAINDFVSVRRPPSTSYALPRSSMMESMIEDANARLCQDPRSFKEQKKVKGLLPNPTVRHRRYYVEKGCSVSMPTTNDSMADLLKSSTDKVSKNDVVYSATEAKDLESGASSSCAVVSWLDHWLMAFGRSALDPTCDEASIRRLLASGGKALWFLAYQVSNLLANMRLKRRDAVLGSLVAGVSPEDKAALRNSVFDDSGRLFAEEIVRDVVKNTRSRTETEVLRKVAFSAGSGKRRPSPPKGHGSSETSRPAKSQKTSTSTGGTNSSSGQDKGSGQPFSRTPGRSKGNQKGKDKKRGGAN